MQIGIRPGRAATIGRPLGAPDWIAETERRLGRPLAPRKGEAKTIGDTADQQPLLK